MSILNWLKRRRADQDEERETTANAHDEMKRAGDEEPESMTGEVQSAAEESPPQ